MFACAKLITIPFAVAAVALLAGCNRAPVAATAPATPVLTVEAIAVSEREAPMTIDTAGVLAPWQEVSIGAEVSGYRIAEIFVDVGTQVSKGRVLAKMEDTLLQADVAQRKAALTEAQAAQKEAQANADRFAALVKSGLSSQQEALQKATAVATASARVASAEAQLATAEQRLNYATIVAPDYGVISARNVSVGQLAPAGSDLFKLIRQNRVEWRAELPESQLGRVKVGMSVNIKRADGTLAASVVRAIAPTLDPNTRRGTAYADFKLDSGIRPGMFATGSIELGKQLTRVVPLSAVTVRDGFSYVFVLDSQNKVVQRRIEVGRFFADGVEVLDGINPQDSIVAQGAGFLRDGDTVRTSTGRLAQQ